jgi:hypothetical protein
MKTIKSLLTLITLLLVSVNIAAQIDLTKSAPIDPGIRTGKLNNGLDRKSVV